MTPEEIRNFEQWGVPLPTRKAHGTPEEIREYLRPMKPTNWRLEGNKLIADVDGSVLVQTIPTDYVLEGTDENGLPKLKKIV